MFKKSIVPILFTAIFLFPAAIAGEARQAALDSDPKPVTLEQALEEASENGKKILIDVYAEWCPYCQRMHSEVYKDESVLGAISDHYIWVKINIESDDLVNYFGTEMTEAEFAGALESRSVPTTVFMNDAGQIIGMQPGFIEIEMFADLLNFVGSDAFLSQDFQEYRNQ